MPLAHSGDLAAYIDKNGPSEGFASTVLIFGEELLCRNALDTIKAALLPDPKSKAGFEPMDGAPESIPDVLERMNTYAFLSPRKLVAVLDSKIFYTKQDAGKLTEKIHAAAKIQDFSAAYRVLLQLTRFLGIGVEELAPEHRNQLGSQIRSLLPEDAVLDKVVEFWSSLDRSADSVADAGAVPRQNPMEMLEHAISKGFPKGNHLVIVTDVVDKRKKLFKMLEQHGLVVDCSIPAGSGWLADQKAQDALFLDTIRSQTQKRGKRIDPAAVAALRDKVGFHLRLLAASLEKLSDYVGARAEITASDVEAVLVKTREDPIYAFTDAVSNRQASLSIDHCDGLLDSGYHPLQILSALINQFRKILVVKDFTENRHPGLWRTGCTYPAFQRQVFPAVLTADAELGRLLEGWGRQLSDGTTEPVASDGKTAGRSKAKVSTDLFVAKNPKSAFPIFQLFRKAELFTLPELISILTNLADADLSLKSTATDPKHLLERQIFFICRIEEVISSSNRRQGPG